MCVLIFLRRDYNRNIVLIQFKCKGNTLEKLPVTSFFYKSSRMVRHKYFF